MTNAVVALEGARSIPSVDSEGSLSRYMREIKKFPVLDPDTEYMLAKRFVEHEDVDAAHQLVTSHLRLVAKVAMGFRHYGLPVSDLVSEGTIGLMRAVKKFDPEQGFRLSTYAQWWIRAAITEFVLKSWSLVKIGTVSAQKKLFFNLRRMKARMGVYEEGDMSPEAVRSIAHTLKVSEDDVVAMNRRLSGGDVSLNAPLQDEDGSGEHMDLLEDTAPNQEDVLANLSHLKHGRKLLRDGMDLLNDRERQVIVARRLSDDPITLEELGGVFGVSRERVRQIENKAFQKLQKYVLANA